MAAPLVRAETNHDPHVDCRSLGVGAPWAAVGALLSLRIYRYTVSETMYLLCGRRHVPTSPMVVSDLSVRWWWATVKGGSELRDGGGTLVQAYNCQTDGNSANT